MYDVTLVKSNEVPPVPPHAPNMQGFIRDYTDQKDRPADPAKIMECLTPKTLPVISSLAHHYALCDHWFASIPTQTFCNRSFVHAGTSSGYVNNGGGGLCFVNETPTRLHDVFEHTSVLSTVANRFGLPKGKLGARQTQALDVSAAISLSSPQRDRPAIAKPEFSFLGDLGAEMHSVAHAKLLDAKQKPMSALQRTALHGVALLTQADELHERIEHLQNELEAGLLIIGRSQIPDKQTPLNPALATAADTA